MTATNIPETTDEFDELVTSITSQEGYVEPEAFGLGFAYVAPDGEKTVVLAVDFLQINILENMGAAAVIREVIGENLNGTHFVTGQQILDMIQYFYPFEDDGQSHPNIDALHQMLSFTKEGYEHYLGGESIDASNHTYVPVVVGVPSLNDEVTNAGDAYLRLTAMSERLIKPNSVNLEGVFGSLAMVVWTDRGPVYQPLFKVVKQELRMQGEFIKVASVDKFPSMLDFVQPSGVRIVEGAWARLGAHLGEGTVLMSAAGVNFNAGTLDKGMVEGRISAGIVVGANSDIGGGVSTIGTLSGGNETQVSVGQYCLLEAMSTLGIPLGDRVRLSVGTEIKATSVVTIRGSREDWSKSEMPDEVRELINERASEVPNSGRRAVKAARLAGIGDAIIRRNDVTGILEVLPRGDHMWGTLNEVLHDN